MLSILNGVVIFKLSKYVKEMVMRVMGTIFAPSATLTLHQSTEGPRMGAISVASLAVTQHVGFPVELKAEMLKSFRVYFVIPTVVAVIVVVSWSWIWSSLCSICSTACYRPIVTSPICSDLVHPRQ